jgi:hypothetical protein
VPALSTRRVDISSISREKKIVLLRRFLPFHDGTLSHDHLSDIFAVLDVTELLCRRPRRSSYW